MSNKEGEEKDLKVILLGECGVGKSNIILRFTNGEFNEDSITTNSTSYIMKSIKKNGITYRINVWDTAGQEKFRSITKMFLKDASIIILVYSIVDKKSFECLDYWYETIIDICDKDTIIGIVGNKYDLFSERVIEDETAIKFALEKKAFVKFISAKDDQLGVDDLFNFALDKYIEKNKNENKQRRKSLKNQKDQKSVKIQKKKCCDK